MGIFDRGSGTAPSGKDLYWHDQLSGDDGGGGGGSGGCLWTILTVVIVTVAIFALLHIVSCSLWAAYKG